MATFQFHFPSGFTFFTDSRNLYHEAYVEFGDTLAPNGIPYAQEIEGWGELCTIGEEFIADRGITIECVE